jgi:hypothetical protein
MFFAAMLLRAIADRLSRHDQRAVVATDGQDRDRSRA